MHINHRLKLKVRSSMESLEQSTATMWTEIIENLWDRLPHFQQWYDEDCLQFNCVKLKFGDDEESDNDEIWLDHEKESPAITEETKQVSQSKLDLH